MGFLHQYMAMALQLGVLRCLKGGLSGYKELRHLPVSRRMELSLGQTGLTGEALFQKAWSHSSARRAIM